MVNLLNVVKTLKVVKIISGEFCETKQESCKSKSIAISSCNKQQVEKTTQLERKLQQIGKIANHSILYNIFASSFRNESVDSNRLQ